MADPFVEILGPLRVLCRRVEELLAEHGLASVHLGIAPGPNVEGPHELHIVTTLASLPAAATADDDFERVIRESRQAEIDQQAEATLQDLESRLRDPGGFLD